MIPPVLPLKVLLIENDSAAANEVRTALMAGGGSFDVEWVQLLSAGLERLSKRGIAAVLLELCLPDSEGIETFDRLFSLLPCGCGQ